MLYSVVFAYKAIRNFECFYPIVNVISVWGCYCVDFLLIYGMILTQTMSFGIALFRYLCLVHQNILLKLLWTPMVSSNINRKSS